MSEQGIVADPLAGLGEVPQDTAREHLAMLARGNAISVTDANTILAGKNFAPLKADALDFAQSQKDNLLADSDFAARYSRGDPAAMAQLYKADILITQSSGNLTDRAPDASQYDALRREVGYNVPDQAAYDTYSIELSGLASSLEIPPGSAETLAADHFRALAETTQRPLPKGGPMSAEEMANWGENQARDFAIALGNDPDATIKSANAILSTKSGRPLDLNKIVRSNGASVATILLFQAQSLNLKGSH